MLPPLLLVAACSGPPALSPESAPQSGYVEVHVQTDAEVLGVTVGGVKGLDLRPDEDGYRVVLQGAPVPGTAELVLHTPDGELSWSEAFTWEPAVDPAFDRVVAIGASLGMGVQGGVPTVHGQLATPSRVVARQSGAYHPVPLLVPGLFPAIGPAEIGPPPECEVPDVVAHIASAAMEVLGKLEDPDTGQLGFHVGRQDPDLVPWQLAVGDSNLVDLVRGPDPGEISQQFMAHLAYDPYAGVTDQVVVSQLDLVDELGPTVVMCADTVGNDVIGAIVRSERVDPGLVTPVEEVEAHLDALAARLEASGAESFLATLPRPSMLPVTEVKRQAALEAGDSEAEVDARIAEIDAAAAAMNAAIVEVADRYPHVHAVDLAARVAEVEEEGVDAGDEVLGVGAFEGLLSTDGVHFSDVGYALVGNAFIDEMNAVFGTEVSTVDLDQVARDDPYHPDALRAGGLEPDECGD